MKKLKVYIPCLILSVLLVFSCLGTSAIIVCKSFANRDKLVELVQENEIIPKVRTELENYFSDKYNETGVPAEVYTEALTDDYLQCAVESNIDYGFSALVSAETSDPLFTAPENAQLEQNITEFFSSYADSIGYTKDENYEEKLDDTIKSAYGIIGEYSDIYKFKTMYNEGILGKAAGLYRNIDIIALTVLGASLLLIVVILLINVKSVSAALYWTGVSALISGIIGIVPCIYISETNYFDAFVIKQPQIFTSFTGLMYGAVDSFMTNQIILAIVGAVLILVFAVVSKKTKKE